ncbi:MAG: ABC transporter permease [Desulfovibrionaceae bacterium]
MIRDAWAVTFRELLLMRRRSGRLLAAMAVSPLLYLVTFGHGVGRFVDVDGLGYAAFLLPGLAAMSSMTQAFALASDINIARFYWRIFEEIQASPVSPAAYVLGEMLAGLLRGVAGAAMVMLLGLPFGLCGHLGPVFWLAVAENAFFFANTAVAVAMCVRSHGDQALLSNFVITPMAFLGGTFFPVDRLPAWARLAVDCIPLTHASRTIRQAWLGQPVDAWRLVLLAAMGLFALGIAVTLTRRAID